MVKIKSIKVREILNSVGKKAVEVEMITDNNIKAISSSPSAIIPGRREVITTNETSKSKLNEMIDEYDAVFLCDFGHGLVDEEVMEIVQKRAKYLILNCQTNSSNKGMNIITKYSRADIFTADQNELNLAFPSYVDSEEVKLKELRRHLNGNGWLTRGARGAWQIDDEEIEKCPAFTLSVKDTIGAGDAFFSLAGIFAAAGAPMEIGTFMGNIGGALGANIVGNRESVEMVNALKFASTLLNI